MSFSLVFLLWRMDSLSLFDPIGKRDTETEIPLERIADAMVLRFLRNVTLSSSLHYENKESVKRKFNGSIDQLFERRESDMKS